MPPTSTYKKIENWWFEKVPQKIRFILVGTHNTIVSYLLFALFWLMIRNYHIAVSLQWAITINISILTMRHFAFQAKGNFWQDYIRGWEVYIFMFLFNWSSLFVLIEWAGLHPLLAQGIYQPIGAITTYCLLKYFSFRRKRREEQS